MTLTRTDRWMLSNQYKMLAKLDPENADHYEHVREILEQGYELHYRWVAEHIYDGDSIMTAEQCREVLDILEMFSLLKQTSADSGPNAWRLKFSGFDGNTESKYMAYSKFFCEQDEGRYPELDRGDKFNSHMPSLERYRRQLAAWHSSKDPRQLTTEDIQRISDAAVHPANREQA